MVKLLELGLIYWIKTRCRAIQNLELDIKASLLDILKGNIKAVKVSARKIDFQGISIESISIDSKSISLALISNKKRPNVLIKDPFSIKANLTLSEEDIQRILTSNEWSWICSKLLGKGQKEYRVEKITINDSSIMINFLKYPEKTFENKTLIIDKGNKGLIFKDKATSELYKIPIDSSITIQNYHIQENFLFMEIMALVKP
tara:strand:+ start:327 stop:932 length:606 start_codon:yes stop_codon:yes gene_type:complete